MPKINKSTNQATAAATGFSTPQTHRKKSSGDGATVDKGQLDRAGFGRHSFSEKGLRFHKPDSQPSAKHGAQKQKSAGKGLLRGFRKKSSQQRAAQEKAQSRQESRAAFDAWFDQPDSGDRHPPITRRVQVRTIS